MIPGSKDIVHRRREGEKGKTGSLPLRLHQVVQDHDIVPHLLILALDIIPLPVRDHTPSALSLQLPLVLLHAQASQPGAQNSQSAPSLPPAPRPLTHGTISPLPLRLLHPSSHRLGQHHRLLLLQLQHSTGHVPRLANSNTPLWTLHLLGFGGWSSESCQIVWFRGRRGECGFVSGRTARRGRKGWWESGTRAV